MQDLVSPPSGAPLLSALGDLAGFWHNDLTVVPGTTFMNPTWPTSTSIDFAESAPSTVVRVGNCATWVRVNDDQHQYGWTGAVVTGDPRVYGRVYVGTNGRGIIYGEPS